MHWPLSSSGSGLNVNSRCGNRRRHNERWQRSLVAEVARLEKAKDENYDQSGIEEALLEAAIGLLDHAVEGLLCDVSIEDYIWQAEAQAESQSQ